MLSTDIQIKGGNCKKYNYAVLNIKKTFNGSSTDFEFYSNSVVDQYLTIFAEIQLFKSQCDKQSIRQIFITLIDNILKKVCLMSYDDSKGMFSILQVLNYQRNLTYVGALLKIFDEDESILINRFVSFQSNSEFFTPFYFEADLNTFLTTIFREIYLFILNKDSLLTEKQIKSIDVFNDLDVSKQIFTGISDALPSNIISFKEFKCFLTDFYIRNDKERFEQQKHKLEIYFNIINECVLLNGSLFTEAINNVVTEENIIDSLEYSFRVACNDYKKDVSISKSLRSNDFLVKLDTEFQSMFGESLLIKIQSIFKRRLNNILTIKTKKVKDISSWKSFKDLNNLMQNVELKVLSYEIDFKNIKCFNQFLSEFDDWIISLDRIIPLI